MQNVGPTFYTGNYVNFDINTGLRHESITRSAKYSKHAIPTIPSLHFIRCIKQGSAE